MVCLVGSGTSLSRSGEDAVDDGGCWGGGDGDGCLVGCFAFPPIFPSPLAGFCWALCGGGDGGFLLGGCSGSGSGSFETDGSFSGCFCFLNLGGVS